MQFNRYVFVMENWCFLSDKKLGF